MRETHTQSRERKRERGGGESLQTNHGETDVQTINEVVLLSPLRFDDSRQELDIICLVHKESEAHAYLHVEPVAAVTSS